MFVRQITRLLATGSLPSLSVQAAADGLPTMLQDSGTSVGDNQKSKFAGAFRGALLKNCHLIEKLDYSPFDATKIWPGTEEAKLGTTTLNRVPKGTFQPSEMSAFSPGVMVSGIDISGSPASGPVVLLLRHSALPDRHELSAVAKAERHNQCRSRGAPRTLAAKATTPDRESKRCFPHQKPMTADP